MSKVPFPAYDDRPVDMVAKANARCGADHGSVKRTGRSVGHSMVGTLAGTDAWFRKLTICSMTPWGIGGSADGANDGKVFRWQDYTKGGPIPWSSGKWNPPGMGDGPEYVRRFGVHGINAWAEAIELSDGGKITTPMSRKQWMSFIQLIAAIAHDGGMSAADVFEDLLHMHHREFCKRAEPWPNTDKDCPFPRVYEHTGSYLRAVQGLMHYAETGSGPLVFTVAGIMLNFVDVFGKPVPKPAPAPAKPVYVNFEQDVELIAGKGGATVRQWGFRGSKELMTLPAGRKFLADGYYHGESVAGDDRWVVMANDPRGRIHVSGVANMPKG